MNNLLGGLIGSVIGGAIGAAVWAGILYGTGYEVGWIAIGVGFLAGLGMAIGAKGEAGPAGGFVAIVVAIGAILGGKYMGVTWLVNKEMGNFSMSAQLMQDLQNPQYAVSMMADDLVSEYEAQGKPLNWPQGSTYETAESQKDYPPDLWADAQARFNAMTASEKQAWREEKVAKIEPLMGDAMDAMRSEIAGQGFLQTFGVFDVLFAVFAIVTAFKVGAGEMKVGSST